MSETATRPRQVDSSPSRTTSDGDGDAPPASPTPRPRGRRAVTFFSVFTVVALVGLGVLGYLGYDASLKIKGGATANVITDPAAPGYVAAVDASPVHLVALTAADDELSAFLLFVPDPAGGDGTIVWCLGELVVQVDGAATSLAQLYSGQGLAASRAEFERALGFGATDARIVGPDDLESAFPEPVTFNNPDPISVEQKGKKAEKFAAGSIELQPDELGEFLTVRGAGEAPENRSTRTAALLAALASNVTGAPVDAAGQPASSSVDDGPDIRTTLSEMGSGKADFVVLPTTRQPFKGSYLYSPDEESIAAELEGVVRFPVSSFPGQRPRVRVLNGTTDTAAASSVAPAVARAGGEVLLVGNAGSLDVATTVVVYSNDAFADVAGRIAEVVGVTAQRSDDLTDSADVDIVLGADFQR